MYYNILWEVSTWDYNEDEHLIFLDLEKEFMTRPRHKCRLAFKIEMWEWLDSWMMQEYS